MLNDDLIPLMKTIPEKYDLSLRNKRIRLVECNDPYTELKKGDMGTIECISKNDSARNNGLDWEDQLWVQWDNGSNLMLLIGRDKYELIT